MPPVFRVIDEGTHVYRIRLRQMLEQVIRANLIALIRRIGDAMHEV